MISPLPPERFGEARYTTELISGLTKLGGVKVIAITGVDAQPLKIGEREIETHPIWNHSDKFYPIRLFKQIRRIRPHLVHVQFGPFGRLFGGLFGEIMLILLLMLRIVGIRTTVTLHSTWMPEQVRERVRHYKRLKRFAGLAPVFFRLYMKLLDLGTTTIQLSTVRTDSTLRRTFIRQYGISPKKVLEIPHAFDTTLSPIDKDHAKAGLKIEHDHVLLMFGFIRRGKGIDVAINAMKQIAQEIPSTLLLVAGQAKTHGDKIYLNEMRTRVKELGLEANIRFDTRYIPDEEVPLYFSAASLVLIPYTESVGASGPVHNFAALGVPFIAANVGIHMPETLGGNLVLFKEGDSNDLADRVIELLQHPEKLEEIAKRQRAYARREPWSVAAKRTIANYYITMKS